MQSRSRRRRERHKAIRSSASYYSALHLRNFRGFKQAEGIRLAPLTFLVGPNSSGKSSIFDAFLFLAQSQTDYVGDVIVPKWSGPLVDLGAYSDVVFGHKQNLRICVGFDVSFDPRDPWQHLKRPRPIQSRLRYEFGSSSVSEDPVGRLKYMEITDVLSGRGMSVTLRGGRRKAPISVSLFGHRMIYQASEQLRRPTWYTLADWIEERALKKVRRTRKGDGAAVQRLKRTINSYTLRVLMEGTQRVASGRSAPKRWYPTSQPTSDIIRFTGDLRLYDSVDPAVVSEERISDVRPRFVPLMRGANRNTMSKTLNKLDIARRIRTTKLSPYHSSINVRDSKLNIESKLIDVGFGASQVIPVIKACLSRSPGPLFIEQPEIHLHPKAQGIVAELICETSQRRQVVVETHSEHMINRARILIAQGRLDYRDVIVNYVTRTKNGSKATAIKIGPDGEFEDSWPEGFFDERYDDTMRLMEISGQDQSR